MAFTDFVFFYDTEQIYGLREEEGMVDYFSLVYCTRHGCCASLGLFHSFTFCPVLSGAEAPGETEL